MTSHSILLLITIALVIWTLFTIITTKKEVNKLQKILNLQMAELKKREENK